MTITFKRKPITNAAGTEDTGEPGDINSIRPVSTGELIDQDVLRRPSDNLRVRTDELARAVGSLEYLVQSAVNTSVLLRYVENTSTPTLETGVLEIYKKASGGSSYYYIAPKQAAAATNNAINPSLIIIGAATNGFSYSINRTAFESFYDQGITLIDNSHNPYLGLSSPGDCIALRIPTVGSSITTEVVLPEILSALDPAGESSFDSTLLAAVQTPSITAQEAQYSLIKVPAKNSVKIFNITAGSALLTTLEAAVADIGVGSVNTVLELEGFNSFGSPIGTVVLDLKAIEQEGQAYHIPRSGYLDLETLTDAVSFIYKINGSAQPSGVAATDVNATTMLPKNEYLYPLATFSGDSVSIPGLGNVAALDIDSRENDIAVMDQTGIVAGELGGAVRIYETRAQFSLEKLSTNVANGGYQEYKITEGNKQYFRLPIEIQVPEAGSITELHLYQAEIQMVLDETIDQTQVIRPVEVSIGLYSTADIDLFTSSSNIKLAYQECIDEGHTSYDVNSLTRTVLKKFDLRKLQDDYIAHIEIPDNIRSTSGIGKFLVVWLYPLDNPSNFFDGNTPGSFRFDLRLKWVTRLGDDVNIADASTMTLLGHS